jgi:acyl carrier protein
MIPSVVVPLEQMPLTPAGKIDRRSLPNPAKTRPKFDQNFVAPSSPLESLLTKIWSEVLEVEQIGVDDNFIELGGHSLLATKALSRLRDACKVEIPLADFFAHPPFQHWRACEQLGRTTKRLVESKSH